MTKEDTLLQAVNRLSRQVDGLEFSNPTAYVYNPLTYAKRPHQAYLEKYGKAPKKIVFLGMNPGPWGMAQTGVPFGEIEAVKQWLKIDCPVDKPEHEHPKRRVMGFSCSRSEVSGRRLWGLFAQRYGKAEDFFKDHFVANYCPLVFMEEGGRNRTPDKLPAKEREALFALCDRHLRETVEILQPQWVIGVGRFAETSALRALGKSDAKIGLILHPSPASPAANKDWAGTVTRQMQELSLW